MKAEEKTFDVVGAMMDWESGKIGARKFLELFAHLVRSGQAWTLQGCYGRQAAALIDGGFLTKGGELTQTALDKLEEVEA